MWCVVCGVRVCECRVYLSIPNDLHVSNKCFQTCGSTTWQRKEVTKLVHKMLSLEHCGTECCHQMDCFFFRRFFLLSSENGRRSVTSFPPFSLLHAMANRDSGTILLLHVVTSLDPLSSTLLHDLCSPKIPSHGDHVLRLGAVHHERCAILPDALQHTECNHHNL